MAEVGRKTDLTEELTLEIRKLVLENISYKKIQEILDITESAWDRWVWLDYKDFRKNLTSWKHQRMVKKAEAKIDVLVDSDDERVALDASKFLASTLGKSDYSTRSEVTGENGAALTVQIVQYGNNPTPQVPTEELPTTTA